TWHVGQRLDHVVLVVETVAARQRVARGCPGRPQRQHVRAPLSPTPWKLPRHRARRVVRTAARAWLPPCAAPPTSRSALRASKDLDQAMSYISDDIVCEAPPGRLEGADAYRAFMAPFVQILRDSKMIAAFGDDETALVMYDTETVPVKSAPGAECVTVRDGKI